MSCMPPLAKFIDLEEDEVVASIRLAAPVLGEELSRRARITKIREMGRDGHASISSITVSRAQFLKTVAWYSSLSRSLLEAEATARVIMRIGSNLIKIADVIRPELSSEPNI